MSTVLLKLTFINFVIFNYNSRLILWMYIITNFQRSLNLVSSFFLNKTGEKCSTIYYFYLWGIAVTTTTIIINKNIYINKLWGSLFTKTSCHGLLSCGSVCVYCLALDPHLSQITTAESRKGYQRPVTLVADIPVAETVVADGSRAMSPVADILFCCSEYSAQSARSLLSNLKIEVMFVMLYSIKSGRALSGSKSIKLSY